MIGLIKHPFLLLRFTNHQVKLFSSKLQSTLPSTQKDINNLPNAYTNQIESEWYEWWKENKFFTPTEHISNKNGRFSMVLPPPNVTGNLHLGHTLTNSIQDAIVRWHRMNGKNTIWIPGLDHAGIATQIVVEKMIWQEFGKTRHEIGRERFLEYVWEWKEKKEKEIFKQLEMLGSSLDWTKTVFTMDPKMADAVTEAFVRLHDEGLIVRKEDLVNWCCHLRSTISDIEVDHVNIPGSTKIRVPGYKQQIEFGVLYYIKYKLDNSCIADEIEIATTRPETIFGDTAIVVNPNDKRYELLHHANAVNPLTGRLIRIYPDENVDPNFGTGVVKVTPAHDTNDFRVGKIWGLQSIDVFDDNGIMNHNCGDFKGLPRFEARKAVLTYLKDKGALTKQCSHSTTLPVCSRSGDVIEYKLKPQWFVKTEKLAQAAIEAVKNGSLEIIPKSHEKTWINWLSANKDWCISRQLAWGHRVPAYRVFTSNSNGNSSENEMWISGRSLEEVKKKFADKFSGNLADVKFEQDNDVLDTWFSSALFPFASMGWPQKTQILDKYYPLDLMETGHDILSFWVSRMIMLGLKLTGVLPFNKILLHGIVCDVHGRKMSKSLGNVIDPIDIINGASLQELNKKSQEFFKKGILTEDELKKAILSQSKDYPNGIPACSADALRFALCSYDIKAHYINLDIRKVIHYRLFCNKIWQAARFVFKWLENVEDPSKLNLNSVEKLSSFDKWILSRLASSISDCKSGFEEFDLHLVTQSLYRFFYYDFCDVYLEGVKPILQSGNKEQIQNVACVLLTTLHTFLLSVSPFMVYLSEELYQRLPLKNKSPTIALAAYPQPNLWSSWKNNDLESEMQVIIDIVQNVRSVNQTYSFKQKPSVIVSNNNFWKCISNADAILSALLKNPSVKIVDEKGLISSGHEITRIINPLVSVHISSEDGKIDREKQLSRITAKEKSLRKKLEKLITLINSTRYQTNFPQNIKDEDQAKKTLLEARLAEINADLLTLERNIK